jgi:hypothetical protein
MSKIPALGATMAMLLVLAAAPAAAQQGMEKKSYNYSAWTPGIFSEAVTITNVGKGKFIFLAGVGSEDENGPRGAIRHRGDFAAQCAYAYDKIKRALVSPVPTFVSPCGTHFYERRNQRDTSNSMIPVRLWI